MVWVGFAFDRKLKLFMWDGNVAAHQLLDAFEMEVEPFFQEVGDNMWSLYQDNAPVHSARLTQDWLQDRYIIPCKIPPYSPDLNPAEHVISMVCRLVYKEGRQFLTIAELKLAIKKAWEEIPQSGINNAIDSMPARLAAVIVNHGGPTDY